MRDGLLEALSSEGHGGRVTLAITTDEETSQFGDAHLGETLPADGYIVGEATVSGGDTRPFGAATEASPYAANGPTVVFGPGVLADDQGPVAHADREYITSAITELATPSDVRSRAVSSSVRRSRMI